MFEYLYMNTFNLPYSYVCLTLYFCNLCVYRQVIFYFCLYRILIRHNTAAPGRMIFSCLKGFQVLFILKCSQLLVWCLDCINTSLLAQPHALPKTHDKNQTKWKNILIKPYRIKQILMNTNKYFEQKHQCQSLQNSSSNKSFETLVVSILLGYFSYITESL